MYACFLYHDTAPAGRLFFDPDLVSARLAAGWVDTPTKLGAPVVEVPTVTALMPVLAPPVVAPETVSSAIGKDVRKMSIADAQAALADVSDVSTLQRVLGREASNPRGARPAILAFIEARVTAIEAAAPVEVTA